MFNLLKKLIIFSNKKRYSIEIKKLNKDYYIIKNFTFITSKNNYNISDLIVSKYGIFIINSKFINGYIVGNDYSDKLTQYFGFKKYFINNPLKYNYSFIKALEYYLNIDESTFISVIVFNSNANINIKTKCNVIKVNNLYNTIRKYKEVKINNPKELYSYLKDLSNKKKSKEDSIIVNNNIETCPKCGSILIKKSGKYGDFLGCSSYPICDYIKK